MENVLGLHHVTAIAGDPRRNIDFYTATLGLRLVKRTVNYDDPGTYHFYFGDEAGTPGSLLTFFPYSTARKGRPGPGQVGVTSLAIRPAALGFWIERLTRFGVRYEGPAKRRLGGDPEQVLSFPDPDGLLLELVASVGAESRPAWGGAPGIPAEHAVRGLHAPTLWVEERESTERVLVDLLGFRPVAEDGSTRRYALDDGGPARIVDVRSTGGFIRGLGGTGTVHHVAWAVADDEAELAFRERITEAGLGPTPVIDRSYFRSVYFREPSGILFEIATVPPGFTVDEPSEQLGEALMLPPRLEPRREEIEAGLARKVHDSSRFAWSAGFPGSIGTLAG